jgi:hypothetical protein
MHQRAVGSTRWNADRYHAHRLVDRDGSAFILEIQFGAAAFGRRFRLYSIVTLVILVVFGVLTFRDAPGVGANLPTPWIGFGRDQYWRFPALGRGVDPRSLTRVEDRQDAPVSVF